ncbi:GNAT family N-acetyltransferase [uncultured Bacteroides sp.]|uniref:GNAT family N-acetyltransferase n=1 Tax=uncultured Bacteroides sp. TaxID=162156 RepID=UPI002AAB8DD8|nr:GNAT family N-acetyltransferase [uncultured Bacteroides sp.]
MELKRIAKKDLSDLVVAHKEAFEDFFLTKLGDKFLYVYYDCIRKDDKGLLIGSYEEGKLIGFCAATFLSQGYYSHLVKDNFLRFALIGVRLFFTDFPALIRLLCNLTKKGSDGKDKGEYAEVLSIGVVPGNQGKGIGRKMLLYVEEELKTMGSAKLSLTTDFLNNDKAIGLYNSLGYGVLYDFSTYPNRRMYRLIKNIK